MSIICTNKDYQYHFKIIIIGEYKSGATSILNRYCDDVFVGNSVSVDLKIKNLSIDNENYKIEIWDHVRGNECFRTISPIYYRGSSGVVFVYDITNIKSFENIKTWWYKEYCRKRIDLRDKVDSNLIRRIDYDYYSYIPPIIILGTKSDLRNQSNYDQCVDFNKVREFSQSINAIPFEVSSKDNINITESISELVSNIKINYLKSKINSTAIPSQTSPTHKTCILN